MAIETKNNNNESDKYVIEQYDLAKGTKNNKDNNCGFECVTTKSKLIFKKAAEIILNYHTIANILLLLIVQISFTGALNPNIPRIFLSVISLLITGVPLAMKYQLKHVWLIYLAGLCGGTIIVHLLSNHGFLFVGFGGTYSINQVYICDRFLNWKSTSLYYNVFSTCWIVLYIILDIIMIYCCQSYQIAWPILFHCSITSVVKNSIIDLVAGVILGVVSLLIIIKN